MFLVILSVYQKISIFKIFRQAKPDELNHSAAVCWYSLLYHCAHFLSQKNSTVHLRLSGSILGLKRVGSSKTFGKTIFLLKINAFLKECLFFDKVQEWQDMNCESLKLRIFFENYFEKWTHVPTYSWQFLWFENALLFYWEFSKN